MIDTEIKVTPQIASEHGLTPEEYARIQKILGRDPNFTELGIFSVMWSEHCSYKSSRVHLKRLPTEGKYVVQGPGENAGVVDIGDGLCAVFKIESHNHPSFVEPFQGAATGVGGILRDIFTMGARPIAVLDSLRFGPIAAGPGAGSATAEDIARNRRILDGVIRGIGFYGNCFLVPTVGDEVVFEPCYSNNPLVNALALGIARREELFFARARGVGNPVIYACLEAMRTGAVVAIQDMGAAGLTSSSSEMASCGGLGIEIDLARVPQRETGMTPYEIMLSESQERMLLVAERGRERQVFEVFQKWGLDAVEVGRVTSDGKLRILDHGRLAAEIPAHAIAEEGPRYERPIAKPPASAPQAKMGLLEFAPKGSDLTEDFRQLLASPTIASKYWITEQYDSMVRTNTRFGPGSGDAAVLRLKETKRALALATDGNGRWCFLAPRLGAMHAVAEAARNVACAGARPIAATNCLNFGNPEKPEVMWQFSEAIDGISEACRALDIPITGGNVSFYNETLGKAIYPTPVLGVLGLLEDAECALGSGFRKEGDAILLLEGKSQEARLKAAAKDALNELSSSEYAKTIHGVVAGTPPAIDLAAEKRLIECLVKLASAKIILSAHDISDGGLAVTLAESCFSSEGLSAEIALDFDTANEAAEFALFGERGARVVVSVASSSLASVRAVAAQYNVNLQPIDTVSRGEFRIQYKGSA